MDYMENITSSDEQVDTIIERNYSSMQNLRSHILHEDELAEPSESVSFIATDDDGDNDHINYLHLPVKLADSSSVNLTDSVSLISQVDSPDLLLPPAHPPSPSDESHPRGFSI